MVGLYLLLVPFLVVVTASPSFAASVGNLPAPTKVELPTKPLIVGLYASPPFVMQHNGQYEGMAVDLWEALARRLNLPFSYHPYRNFGDLLRATESGAVDVAVTNVTITQARAKEFDFTQPWFDGGLRILVGSDKSSGFGALLRGLRDAGFLRVYGWIALVVVISTLFLTLFDRRFNQSFPGRWREGIAESFYAVMSIVTSGKMPPRPNLFGWVGRIVQGLWLVFSLAVLAYVTSSVTSVMTTLSLAHEIHDLNDLNNKITGVQSGSTAERFMREKGLSIRAYADTDALVEALRRGEIDAIVGDAPVLEYTALKRADLGLDVVGPIFEPEKYGFALPLKSPYTKRLTIEILGAREREEIERLRVSYFGEDR